MKHKILAALFSMSALPAQTVLQPGQQLSVKCVAPGHWSWAEIPGTTEAKLTCVKPVASAVPNLCRQAPTGLPALTGTLPALPQSCYQPAYPTVTTSTTTVTTAAGLQAAIKSGKCGEKIVVTANTVYSIFRGPAIPGTVCPSNNPILVVSSAIGSLPPYTVPSQAAASWSGTAQGGSPSTITLDANASSTDGAYDSRKLYITGGTGKGQVGTVSSYDGSTKVATMAASWTRPPDSSSMFIVASLVAPTIACTGAGCGAMGISDNASGWYFAGIDFTVDPGVRGTYPVIAMGNDTTTVAALPRYITFDRDWVHTSGEANVNQASRGIDLNAVYGTVMFSNIWGFVSTSKDTQAILVMNTPGPLLLAGNHLEATGENIALFTICAPGAYVGQGIPSCVTPSDITITRNHVQKLPAWRNSPAGCVPGGSPPCYDVKNSIECKMCQRVLVDSNWVDTSISQGQPELTIMNCFAPGIFVCTDMTYTNNLWMHAPAVLVVGGNGTPNTGQRIMLRNNLAIDINGATWGGQGMAAQIGGATSDIRLDHDTIINYPATYPNTLLFADGAPSTDPNFQYTNSFVYGGPMSNASNQGYTIAGLPSVTLGGSVFVGDWWPLLSPSSTGTPAYPAGIYSVASTATPVSGQPACNYANKPIPQCWALDWALVGFVDFAGGNAGTNLPGMVLTATSPYKGKGTDGFDIGANVPAVLAAIDGVQ